MRHVFSALTVVVLAAPSAAWADIITCQFGGYVTSVNQALGLDIHPDDVLSGTFSFDTATPDGDPDPSHGYYQQQGFTFSVSVGGYEFTTGDFGLEVFASMSGDQYVWRYDQVVTANGFWMGADGYGPFNDGIPLTPRIQSTEGGIGPGFRFVPYTTSWVVTPVPEPSSLVLLTAGLLGACARRSGRG